MAFKVQHVVTKTTFNMCAQLIQLPSGTGAIYRKLLTAYITFAFCKVPDDILQCIRSLQAIHIINERRNSSARHRFDHRRDSIEETHVALRQRKIKDLSIFLYALLFRGPWNDC